VIKLVPFEEGYLETYREWINDPEVMSWLVRSSTVTRQEHRAWYQRMLEDRSTLVRAITTADGCYIGNAWLWGIDWIHRKAGTRIVIGPRENRSKGFGAEALIAMVDIAFKQLNLHRLYAYIRADNDRALKSFAKAGFKVEGTLRSDRFVDGGYIDMVLVAKLRMEEVSRPRIAGGESA